MNTTKTGNDFEDKVFSIINELLQNDEFTVPGKRSRIYQKRPYYSESRKGNIITDISIETFLPNADKYSILHVFECKYLNKNVSIDDIEEFDSKLSQIGKHNSKGIIASNIGFSKSTINFANSLKIALLKIKTDNQLDWINYRKEYGIIDFENDQTEPFLAKSEKKVSNNIADFLLQINVIDFYTQQDKFLNVKYLSVEHIKSIAERLLKYDITTGSALDTEKLIQFISDRYPIKFERKNIYPILGKIEFNPLRIIADTSLEEHRYRFTLCHEIGHLVLHKNLFSNTKDKEDYDYTLSLNGNISDSNTRRIEIQANLFASYLLLPTENFQIEVMKFFILNKISKNHIYVDKQPVNRFLADNLISELSNKFNASRESVRLKLIDLKLLQDNTRFSYRELISNLKR
jgi:Zn-dependent peptidase ImmA (M78 family)